MKNKNNRLMQGFEGSRVFAAAKGTRSADAYLRAPPPPRPLARSYFLSFQDLCSQTSSISQQSLRCSAQRNLDPRSSSGIFNTDGRRVRS